MHFTPRIRRSGIFLGIVAGFSVAPFACSGPADLRTLGESIPKKKSDASTHVTATGGHSDSGTHKDSGSHHDAATIDGATACADYAAIKCAKLDACSQSTYVAQHFASKDQCLQREALTCLASLDADDNAATPAGVERCGTALNAVNCTDFFDHMNIPSSCIARPGPRANGSSCAFDGQCESTWCYAAANWMCGVCETRPANGDSCAATGDCGGQGLSCSHAGTCVPYASLGDACGPQTVCPYATACVGATATTMGTCMAQGAEAGAPCDGAQIRAPLCATSAGYFCPSATDQCAVVSIVGFEDKCGVMAADAGAPDARSDARAPSHLARCAAGGACSPSTANSGICIAPAEDGQPCDTVLGPPCLDPARCLITGDGSTAGVCSILGVSATCD